MNDPVVIGAAIFLAIVVALPLIGGLAAGPPGEQAGETPAPQPQEPKRTQQEEDAMFVKFFGIRPPRNVPTAPKGQPQAIALEYKNTPPPLLNEQNLGGAAFKVGKVTIEFEQGGRAHVFVPNIEEVIAEFEMDELGPDFVKGFKEKGVPARYKIEGSWIIITAFENAIKIQIAGNDLLGPMGPFQRIR